MSVTFFHIIFGGILTKLYFFIHEQAIIQFYINELVSIYLSKFAVKGYAYNKNIVSYKNYNFYILFDVIFIIK